MFFDSPQPLVTSVGGTSFVATNHALNVYEWTPAGLEGCQPPAGGETGGCLGLLSSGTDPFPSYFQGASADAENVYITTHAALVPQDQDGLNDIYDVRVDGGIPAPAPAPVVLGGNAGMPAARPGHRLLAARQRIRRPGAATSAAPSILRNPSRGSKERSR